MNLKETEYTIIDIAVIGDKGVGKSTFINDYMKQYQTSKQEKNGSISVEKEINNSKMKIIMHEYSLTDSIVISFLQECQAIFLLFNMASRESFSNLFNNWFIWLRDECRYEGIIYVMGNYFGSDPLLFTSAEELTEAINISQINANFYELGNKSLEDKLTLIDGLVQEAEISEINKRRYLINNKGGSGECNII
jgi:ABC-type dipeptide/oligopeptide/nickel transport system ATPase component